MEKVYFQKTIDCQNEECGERIGKIIIKPIKIEIYLRCKKEHGVLIEIDKKTNEVEVLEEK